MNGFIGGSRSQLKSSTEEFQDTSVSASYGYCLIDVCLFFICFSLSIFLSVCFCVCVSLCFCVNFSFVCVSLCFSVCFSLFL